MDKTIAWVRFCSDGSYEGPIMDCDSRMDDVRRKSGAWTPLGVIDAQPASAEGSPVPDGWQLVPKEQIEAVKSYINHVKLAQKVAPDEPVAMIFSCGCLGPLPECKCAKRRRLIDAFLSDAQTTSAEVKPVADGWQLVPKEPTEEMEDAMCRAECGTYRDIYKAMLAVAPTPPQQPRQESEIAAEALEEAAKMIDMDDLAWERPSVFLRALATQKRGQE